MNQHDQMLSEALRLLYHVTPSDDVSADLLVKVEDLIKQAVAHVNETPKNEHDSDDVLKPAPLVRLTEEEIASEYSKADAYLMMTDHYEFGLVANAIMDAMTANNGGC